MFGEWCSDWYHDDYFQIASKTNPKGPDYGTERVVEEDLGSVMIFFVT